MRCLKLIISTFILIGLFVACQDYLDQVPDERPTEEDAFDTDLDIEGYLYSIYSFIPTHRGGSDAIDLFSHETGYIEDNNFTNGNYTASNPDHALWGDLYKGIRQAYIFLDRLDDLELSDSKKTRYKAETEFLIGYFHFYLLKMYGPIPVVDQEIDFSAINPEDYPEREPIEKVVDFIVNKMDLATQDLPLDQGTSDFGRATSVVAKAIKAKTLLYAASPLFNGGGPDKESLYDGFTNADGEQLIPTTFNKEKWKQAAEAGLEAIDMAEGAGHVLYKNSNYSSNLPTDPVEKDLRFTFVDRDSKEFIWAETRREGAYDYQIWVTPPGTYAAGSRGATLNIIEEFYTENGLPIDKDPAYDYSDRFSIEPNENGPTLNLNLGREPRFYAWVAFHNGNYEYVDEGRNDVVITNRKNDEFGRQEKNVDYSPTGYFIKKGVHPDTEFVQYEIKEHYPWPIIRLSNLYLEYAEALIEYGDDLATAKEYIDRVRERAGIPTIDDAWESIGGAQDQNTLRDIVRQERAIEFFMENERFWDLRRWQKKDVLEKNLYGLNINGATDEEYFQKRELPGNITFPERNFLQPIPQNEIDKNENLIQNPDY